MANKTANGRYKPTRMAPDREYEMSAAISSAIAQKKRKQKAKRRGKAAAITFTILGGLIVIAAIVYIGGWMTSVGKFLPNTFINGTEVSKMTLREACMAVSSGPASNYLSITKKDGTSERIPLDYFDYEFNITPEIQGFYESINYSDWISAFFKPTHFETVGEATFDREKLEYILRNTAWGTAATSDAKLIHTDNGYEIKSEVYGDIPDTDKMVKFVLNEVDKGRLSVNLGETDCFTEPAVFARDLENLKQQMNEKFNFVITYDFDYTTETLTGADVYDWLKMSSDGTYQIDRTKAESFIATLAQKYDTFMTTRNFETTNRGIVQIAQNQYSTGQYGWWIDQEKSVEKLLGYIEAGQTITTEPMYVTLESGYCYEGFPSGRSAKGDIGDTYIEIDLTAQHLWYYKEGVLDFETDQIVSGKATDSTRKTPGGVYSVYTKATDYTMKGANYTAKCKYFLRCSFEGIGLHDLSRSAYGGNTYINNGSHGCINMRYNEVKYLYETVERGTPVIMYY